MTRRIISTFILACVSLLLIPANAWAQDEQPTTPAGGQRARGVQVNVDSLRALLDRKPKTLEGFQLSVDAVGAAMWAVGSYGQLEGALRLNIKQRYFPIVEAGLGMSDHTDDETNLHYKTSAPYARLGCDYNFNNDIFSGNRVYGGLRLGYTKFKYDIDGPDLVDPVWGDAVPYRFENLDGNFIWAELVFGLEANISRRFHLGWSLRYKKRLGQKADEIGPSWYVPGYGQNLGHCFGATFNIIFDI